MRALFVLPALLLLAGCPAVDDEAPDDTDVVDTGGDTGDTGGATGDTGAPDDTGTPGPIDPGDTDPELNLVLPDVPPESACANPVPAVSGGDCGFTEGTGAGLLLHVGTVLGPLETFTGGAQVLVDADGLIACVGCDCSAEPAAADARVVTCPSGVASPGLINAHDHITFDEQAPFPPTTTRYEHRHDWRATLSTPGNANGDGTRWSEIRQVMAGTTSMLGSGGMDGFVRNHDRNGRDEGLDLILSNQTFPLGDGNRQFRSDCGWNYGDGELAVAGMEAWIGHVAEGIDDYAAEEIRCLSTSFDGGQDLTQDHTAHVHGVGLQAVDYGEMARDGTLLVWSPRTNIFLYGHTAQVRLFDTLGGRIALGTDWTYSGSATIQRELTCAASYNDTHLDGWFTDVDLWRMVTEYGAEAIGGVGVVGRLREGYVADLAVFDDNSEYGPHETVVEAAQVDTLLVLRGGEVLYGDATAVQGLDATCDTVDVCGASRAICTDREIGEDWSAFSAQMASKYPAIFCGTPEDEPTCVPFRTGEFDGLATATDADGDGIEDPTDNCPRVFNAIRPIDDGAQPDADEDGVGDACDPTPLPADLDGDGVDNALDVCWRVDDDQADADRDGVGDVCDACPSVFAPDGICPPTPISIPDAKAEGDGTSVTVEGVVTGVFPGRSDFWVQDPSVVSAVDAGIRVFGASSAPSIGDRVRVTGTLDTYFNARELDAGQVAVIGSGTVTPVRLTVSAATGEDYEGALVTLTDATVSDADHDCSADVGACSDSDLWEVGGPTGIVVDKRAFSGSDADWTSGITDGEITGVMDFRFDRRRIHPRTASDLP